jgi:DNA-directed RNA polymerase specialized sigma subunit
MANYIKNADLLAEFKKWKESGNKRIPESLARMFLTIARRYSNKFYLSTPEEREDMVSNAMIHLCSYAHNFNPDIGNNPFAYVTQIIKNGFNQCRDREVKYKDTIVEYFLNDEDADMSDEVSVQLAKVHEEVKRTKASMKEAKKTIYEEPSLF